MTPLRNRAALEDAALTATAGAVIEAALERVETRGCNHRSDHPDTDPAMAVSTTVRLSAGAPNVAETATMAC